jgi:hypothetical protein
VPGAQGEEEATVKPTLRFATGLVGPMTKPEMRESQACWLAPAALTGPVGAHPAAAAVGVGARLSATAPAVVGEGVVMPRVRTFPAQAVVAVPVTAVNARRWQQVAVFGWVGGKVGFGGFGGFRGVFGGCWGAVWGVFGFCGGRVGVEGDDAARAGDGGAAAGDGRYKPYQPNPQPLNPSLPSCTATWKVPVAVLFDASVAVQVTFSKRGGGG